MQLQAMMLYLGVVFCLLSACAAQMKQFPTNELCSRTPMTFQEDFLSSCEGLGRSENDCMSAWMAFRGAFAGVDPQSVTSSDYEPYFNSLPIEVMADQSLFWTRTSSLVDILSMMNAMGVKVVSSFNTISSEIINGISTNESSLNWCGIENGMIDFENPCLCNVTGRFWYQFSYEFGVAAVGTTFYLADGEDPDGAFRENSFFSTVELPSMGDNEVTRLVAMIVHREGMGESCSDGPTVQILRDRVNERPFSFDCYDILAQANDPSATTSTANCIRGVIDDVQMNMEGSARQIQCDGSAALRVSMMGLFLSFCISILCKVN